MTALAACVIAGLIAAACGAGGAPTTSGPSKAATTSPTGSPSSSASETGGPIVLGALEGPIAEGGPDFANGMQLAVKLINTSGGVGGRPLELKIFQSSGTVEDYVAAYKEAAADPSIAGVFHAGVTGALAIRAQSDSVALPFITASGNDAIDRPPVKYVFKNSPAHEGTTSSLTYAVKNFGAKSVAAIYYGTDYSVQIPDALENRCAELGCQVVALENAAADAPVDALTPQLTKMRAANPDVYYIEGLNPSAFAAARQLGLDKPIISETWLAIPALRDACGQNCHGVTFAIHKCNVPELLAPTDPLKGLCEEYRTAYEAEFGSWAGFSIYGRDAVYALAAAARRVVDAGQSLTRETLASSLEQFDGELTTTAGTLRTAPDNHRLSGQWSEGYIDVVIKVAADKSTWVLAPNADVAGSTP
ncbi:MAG: ABC transporter substrate-binding protein [Chloroflexi bacterium]|nr:ABC transporter substrate-binding protein [Chloroflexota bacterium]